jgi:hypothetical protein
MAYRCILNIATCIFNTAEDRSGNQVPPEGRAGYQVAVEGRGYNWTPDGEPVAHSKVQNTCETQKLR